MILVLNGICQYRHDPAHGATVVAKNPVRPPADFQPHFLIANQCADPFGKLFGIENPYGAAFVFEGPANPGEILGVRSE
jgi:hypothetical protein